MVTKRAEAAINFLKDKATATIGTRENLLTLQRQHPLPDGFSMRLPYPHEKINTIFDDAVVVPFDHFVYGLRFPLFPEFAEILEYYGFLVAQIAPNSIASIISYLTYFRLQGIKFSLNVFRNLFHVRAYKDGTVFFATNKLRVLNVPNKIPKWQLKFVIVKGNHGRLPLESDVREENTFLESKLYGVEAQIAKFLTQSSLDTEYYIPRVETAMALDTSEFLLMCPADKPYYPGPTVLTASEKRKAREAEMSPENSPPDLPQNPPPYSSYHPGESSRGPPAVGSPPILHESANIGALGHIFGLGYSLTDAAGFPSVKWDEKGEKVTVSTDHGSFQEGDEVSPHAQALLAAIVGKGNTDSVYDLFPKALPYVSAQQHLRSASIDLRLGLEYIELRGKVDALSEENHMLKQERQLFDGTIQGFENQLKKAERKQEKLEVEALKRAKIGGDDMLIRLKAAGALKPEFANATFEQFFPEAANINWENLEFSSDESANEPTANTDAAIPDPENQKTSSSQFSPGYSPSEEKKTNSGSSSSSDSSADSGSSSDSSSDSGSSISSASSKSASSQPKKKRKSNSENDV